ncbi:MAG: CPBP family intramembrane metalloprotease [Lewinellaceae bacterium]|nr:CPBP family intramembrane metalloprotease [Lewinellaceae bacterium]
MVQFITAQVITLVIISPIIVIALNKSDQKQKSLLLFAGYYLIYACLLFTPLYFPEFKFINTDWNWSGKTYAIAGSLFFYALFRNEIAKQHNHITFKQRNNKYRSALLGVVFLYLITIGLAIFCIKHSDKRTEQLWFQFIIPGIDEELAYRGIMLGLLSTVLKPKIYVASKSLGNPALIITSIMFGLVHSFSIDHHWGFHQNWFEFINMFLVGLFLGWLTIKSGSILIAVLSHNLINTLLKIIFWM